LRLIGPISSADGGDLLAIQVSDLDMVISLSSDPATIRTTPITEISWISAIRILTTSEEEEVGVKAALQSHGGD